MPGLDLNKSGHDGSSGEKKRLVPGLEAPLDPFRAGSGMSDDDVGLDREREATFVNIGRQPSVYFSKQRGACTLTRFADCAAQRRTGEVTEYKLVRRRVAERLYGRANGDVFEIRIADESTQLIRVAEAEGSGGDRPCRLRTNMARQRVGSDRKPPASLDRPLHTEN